MDLSISLFRFFFREQLRSLARSLFLSPRLLPRLRAYHPELKKQSLTLKKTAKERAKRQKSPLDRLPPTFTFKPSCSPTPERALPTAPLSPSEPP